MTADLIILKILLYVFLIVLSIILLLIVIGLWLPITVDFSFINGKFRYKANFSFIRLIDSDGKGFLKRKKKKIPTSDDFNDFDNSESEDLSDFPECDDDYDFSQDDSDTDDITEEIKENNEFEEKSEKSEKKSVSRNKIVDKIEFLISIWEIGEQPLLRAFKGFRFKNMYIDFIVADENAYNCAINYGQVCSVVYNALAWLGEIFTVSYKTVDIQCGFSIDKSQWDCSCELSFRLYNLVIAGIWFLVTYIFRIFIPEKLKRKK